MRFNREIMVLFRALVLLLASFGLVSTASALPSCPTLIYEGASPATGGLIDPGNPVVTFTFNRDIVPMSVTGGTAKIMKPGFPPSYTTVTYPRTAFVFDDYGVAIPVITTVSGKTVRIQPLNLQPNKAYRFLIRGSGSPVLAYHPDDWSRQFCKQPSINYNIVAEYLTRPNTNGACLSGPTNVTAARYGLTRGCKYNFSFVSHPMGLDEEEYIDMTWAWGPTRTTLRIFGGYPASEYRGVKVDVKNLSWNGSVWAAQSVVVTATGAANTPLSVAENGVVNSFSNATMAFADNVLSIENWYNGPVYGFQNFTNALVPGSLTLSPAP